MLSDEVLTRLNSIPGIGPVTIQHIERLTGQECCAQWEDLLLLVSAQRHLVDPTGRLVESLVLEQRSPKFDGEYPRAREKGYKIVTWHHSAYPQLLRSIYAPPPVLYVAGDLSDAPSMGVVGSRNANEYGLRLVNQFIPLLVTDGWSIVSGGARGIDGHAHRAVLRAAGKTVVVCGSGLTQPYPYEHRSLFKEIVDSGGALISAFPLATQPVAHNFPARNRIIAGMSKAIMVLQAAARSGALITALSGLREGREIAMVPGSIFDPLSAGVHALLRDGAVPILSCEGLLEWARAMHSPVGVDGCKTSNVAEAGARVQEDALLQYCEHEARSCEDIADHCAISVAEVSDRLWQYAISGDIIQTATGKWVRSRRGR